MITVRDYLSDQKILGDRDGSIPEISVVLPTYARCKNGMLERSIKSVLGQTFRNFELLVIDDGSVDGTYDLIEQFRSVDPRIIHVRHERNSGIHSIRLNEGLALARGRYIAFQFDDDALLTNAFEDLHAEIIRHTEPVFVLGHSHFKGPNGEWSLPQVEINLVNLYEQNRFANNAVLFPRDLLDIYGMYDCHIGMRRLCDWDLWLRFIKHVLFIVIPQYITRVYESNPGSLGLTVPYDLALFYYLHGISRDHLLTPAKWEDYEIDSLKIGDVELVNDFARRLYEEQIAPYYARFRHHFPQLEGFSSTYSELKKRTLMITKQSYDTCNDVTVGHYDILTNLRNTYKSYYQPLSSINGNWVAETDLLLLMRTVENPARALLTDARNNNIPVGYYLDDDLLTFHEYGLEFNYLAPGTTLHNNLVEFIQKADAVLVTNQFIANSVRPLNPRIVPHNNTVPVEYLPVTVRDKDPRKPIRIAYAGQSYRITEFQIIWDGLVKLSEEYKDRIEFEFWGLDVSTLPKLNSPVKHRSFTWSYLTYLQDLKDAGIDILLTPLLDSPRPRLGKSLIKYYECAVAGALGIFSDVPQYQDLPDGLTCLKAQNTASGWEQTLRKAIEMPEEEFNLFRLRALEHVREEYSASGQIHYHEAALRAIEFHAQTQAYRSEDGRPRIMYVLHSVFFGGGEIQVWRRLHLVRNYGIEPIVVLPGAAQNSDQGMKMREWLESEDIQVEFAEYICFTEPRSPQEFFSEPQRESIRDLLERCKPALVHTITFIPSFGQICSEMGIPHISTQYAIEDHFHWPTEPPRFEHCNVVQSDSMRYVSRWSELLGGVTKKCARDMAPMETFKLGQLKHLKSLGQPLEPWPPKPVRMAVAGTFQERKQQLETIQAVSKLVRMGYDCTLDFYGYTHYFPEYMKKCRQAIREGDLEDRVTIHEFSHDIASIMSKSDILLSVSTFESFPGAIKDAIASGVLVVATPVGGVKELIIDGVSGILCENTSLDAIMSGIQRALSIKTDLWQQITEQARKVARSELHPYRAANDTLEMYNSALRLARQNSIQSKYIQPKVSIVEPSQPVLNPEKTGEILFSPRNIQGGAVYVGAGLRYIYQAKHANWSGLGVFIGTSLRPASGQLVLKIFSPAGRPIRSASIDLASVHDNQWGDFHFLPIYNSINVNFSIEFTVLNRDRQTLVSLYEDNDWELRAVRGVRRVVSHLGLPLNGHKLYSREWFIN